MPEISSRISPIVAIAAVSILIFSAAGIGVMTGIIPSSLSKTDDQAAKPKQAASAPRKQANEPARVATAEPARTAQACTNCGSVTSVDLVKHKGEGSGLGAVGGAVVGGVLGHQVGSGRGRDVATVAGAGAGAYAGHQIEKEAKSTQNYNVAVRLDDGTSQTFSYQSEPAFRVGDKVRIVEGKLVAR